MADIIAVASRPYQGIDDVGKRDVAPRPVSVPNRHDMEVRLRGVDSMIDPTVVVMTTSFEEGSRGAVRVLT